MDTVIKGFEQRTRQAAINLLSSWSLNSGKKLPLEVPEAMDELDALALKTEWTDFELGVSEGLRVRIAIRLVQEGINQCLPDLLKYIPTTLLF